MNGFIKKGTDKKFPFNTSKNIEHKGFKLFDYLEILNKNIINLFNINQPTFLGLKFAECRPTVANTYQDINYTTEYNRYTSNQDFLVNANGIYIKSMYKKNLIINLATNIRADSGQPGLRYFKIEQYRNGSLIDSEFTATEVTGNGRANVVIPCYFKVTYNDNIKIKMYGQVNDTFLLTKINMELRKEDNINYYTN